MNFQIFFTDISVPDENNIPKDLLETAESPADAFPPLSVPLVVTGTSKCDDDGASSIPRVPTELIDL